jgi:RNA methyltransferase, TrmH family
MQTIQEISSKENQFVKLACSLQQKKYREELNLILLEGKKLIQEAIKKNIAIKYVFVKNKDILAEFADNSFDTSDVYISDDELMKKISTTETPAPIIAIASQPTKIDPLDTLVEQNLTTNKNIFLFCDTVRDPGNLGSIIRTAFAAGVKGIYISPESADVYNSKTLRSSMGAVFYGGINYISFDNLITNFEGYLQQNKTSLEIIGTSPHAKKSYCDISSLCPLKTILVVIGNEADGLSEDVSKRCTELIKIPLANEIESINVLAATSIILFDLANRWK